MEGPPPLYSSFVYKRVSLHQVPVVTFASEVNTITSRVFKYRPRRFPDVDIPLYGALDLLRDVRRLLQENHPVIAHAIKEALDLADRFIAPWFATTGLSEQLENILTIMEAHVRIFYVTFLARYALDGRKLSYYAVDMFGVHVKDTLGTTLFLPWMEVAKFCWHLKSGQNPNIFNNTSLGFGHSGALLGNDVKVDERHGQAQQEAGSLGDLENVEAFMLGSEFAAN